MEGYRVISKYFNGGVSRKPSIYKKDCKVALVIVTYMVYPNTDTGVEFQAISCIYLTACSAAFLKYSPGWSLAIPLRIFYGHR